MPGLITQYVLKVHSRCDLACDHCYVYEHADQSWRAKPHALPVATAQSAAARIAEHAVSHQLPGVKIVLHGGEPLLIGKERMRDLLDVLDCQITPVTSMDVRVHTNGLLLDERWCALFGEHGVKVGVSLDGDRAANDRHRKYADGRSSHSQVRKALELLRRPEHRHLYAGILCTVDVGNDPIAVYEALLAEEPARLDLLLPHATWSNPPPRPGGLAQPYADWLIQIYRRWISDGRPVPIRFFDSLMSAASGGPSWSEVVGLEPVDLLVVDTDGSWEQPDSLKTAYHGAPATGFDVFSHPVDEVTRQPGFVTRLGGLAALSAACRSCSVVRICGGGLYAHRYRAENGFDNPTVYCADMKALISHMTGGQVAARPAAAPPATHVLPAGAFEALAAGPGNVGAIRALAEMRLSVTRALVATVARADQAWTDPTLRQVAAEGWALLCALDAEYPEAVREIFAHPYAYAWAVRCLRHGDLADADLDRAHLASLAAAAAARAGVTTALPVPVRAGRIHLPTVGSLAVPVSSARTAVVRVSPGKLSAAEYGGRWLKTRRVAGGLLKITLEDLDPFRDCQNWPAAGRRAGGQWQSWPRALTASGSRLATALPGYASVLGAGLRTVVPLRPDRSASRSATARHAFGAVAIALPRQPKGLDALLLHEFQHVKLHALTDLHPLFDTEDARRLRVPWRPDPRPVEGALHGAYAHLALAHLSLSLGRTARDGYLRYRSWVVETTEALSATGALTSDGERFVAGMQAAARRAVT
jgi:uncharacterized protein